MNVTKMQESVMLVRTAAYELRDCAMFATVGPWEYTAGCFGLPSGGPDHMRVVQSNWQTSSESIATLDYDQQGGNNAAYIATMNPVIGNLLADWLDDVATSSSVEDGWDNNSERALEIAKEILNAK